MIECPRLLFPFARQIIADASRNGGFPPLLIDPIDFVALYRQRLAEMQAPASAAPAPERSAQTVKPAWRARSPSDDRRPRPDMADHLGGGEMCRVGAASVSGMPRARPKRKPAANRSPAPVVSTTVSTGVAGTSSTPSRRRRRGAVGADGDGGKPAVARGAPRRAVSKLAVW